MIDFDPQQNDFTGYRTKAVPTNDEIKTHLLKRAEAYPDNMKRVMIKAIENGWWAMVDGEVTIYLDGPPIQ